jgi:hypothetical protein
VTGEIDPYVIVEVQYQYQFERYGRRIAVLGASMTTEEAIVDTIRALPPDHQQEVLHFAEFLQQKTKDARPEYKTLFGFWTDVDVSADDIAQARQEMWDDFPREAP